jgi:hypothetical protein
MLAVFLELAKFASLLLSILSLDAVFHSAFLEPASDLQQRLLPSLELLMLAAAICLASGAIFWWASGVMALLFCLAWLLNLYFPVRGPVNG